ASRPCLLLLPGLLCDETVWAAQRRAFEGVADVIVPSWGEQSSLAEMARSTLAEAPSELLCIAGHSMGGRVALEMARQAPHRIQRLALFDTGVDPLPESDAGVHERARRMELLRMARERGMRAMGAEWARGMVHPSRLDSPVFDEILAMIERKPHAVFEAQIQALLARPDARSVLAGLRCPTLIACGREDNWSPLARHEGMHKLLSQWSRLVVIENSGHMTSMEQPDAVSRALLEWMEA
ncbi:MAG TPA: alpha/beta hydrolase, partial [Ramlibacter sp.]|nr:alpha/beta hydrolase [Ramlibacter sp.]